MAESRAALCRGVVRFAILGMIVASCSTDPVGPRRHAALFIGDSIMAEVRRPLGREMAARSWKATVVGRPGASLCALPYEFEQRLARHRPEIAVVETQGDPFSPCMAGGTSGTPVPLGSREFFRRNRAAMNQFARIAQRYRAHLVFVSPLPVPGEPTIDSDLSRLRDLERSLASHRRGVVVTDAPRDAVTRRGEFVDALPCLAEERGRRGCVGGQIRVRDRLQGLHLCPVPYPDIRQTLRGCPEYASGSVRYARALVRTVVRHRRARP